MENTTEERMENTTETRMGGMDMSDKKMNAESLRGTVCVLLSAVCFSTGGVLIKSIPWSSVTIQGARSIFSVLVVGCYMLLRRQKFVWNKTVLFGAVCNTVMAFAFVAATKLTTAANAIVLQFTEPVFVILLMWLIFHKSRGGMRCLPARESLQGFSASFIRRWMPEPWRGICLRFSQDLPMRL